MRKIISWILPKERKILGILAIRSENSFDMAKKLKDFINIYPKLERKGRKEMAYSIREMNDRIKGLGNDLMRNLNGSVNDRDEIHRAAMLLNEIAELTGDCAVRFVVLGIERIDAHIMKLAALFSDSAEELTKIMSVKRPNSIKIHHDRLNSLKFEAEETYDEALSELFHFYKNSIDIIKYREIYELLKNGVRKCASAAEALDIMAAGRS
jgi:uncharacterized protein Yka (UPF0111/DUF47 family)